MARRYNNYFFDDNPPVAVQQQQPTAPVQQPDFNTGQSIDLKDEPSEQPVQQVTPPQAPVAQPEDSRYLTPEQIKQRIQDGYTNPIMAMINQNKPVIDEAKQERLKRVAAINSVGKGLGTILQGFYGKKGANIPKIDNTLLPQVYSEYMKNQQDYDNKVEAMKAQQLAAKIKGLELEQSMLANQDQNKLADARTKDERAFQTERQQAGWDQQEKMAKTAFDNQLKMFDKNQQADLEKMAKQHGYQKALQAMQQAFSASENAKNREYQEGLYEKGYKGGTGQTGVIGVDKNKSFAFTTDTGTKTINGDKLDEAVGYVLSKAASSNDRRFLRNKKAYEKILSDGKMTASDAYTILSTFADDYIDVSNGDFVPKGMQPQSQTGGAY